MGRNQKQDVKPKVSKIESKVAQYLDDLSIEYVQNCPVGKYNVDFLIRDTYIIECYGGYWHCDPTKYEPDYYSRGLKCEAHEKWTKDQHRQSELESMGHSFLVLWESLINSSPRACKSKIKKLLTIPYKGIIFDHG